MSTGIRTRTMNFPDSEHAAYKERLEDGKTIFTTRLREEQGKYTKGEVVDSPFGLLEILDVTTYEDLNDHPFLEYLTPDQIYFISGQVYDVIELEWRRNTVRSPTLKDFTDGVVEQLQAAKFGSADCVVIVSTTWSGSSTRISVSDREEMKKLLQAAIERLEEDQ